jgi:hypothetical protein
MRRDGLFEFVGLARFGIVREKIDRSEKLANLSESAREPKPFAKPL